MRFSSILVGGATCAALALCTAGEARAVQPLPERSSTFEQPGGGWLGDFGELGRVAGGAGGSAWSLPVREYLGSINSPAAWAGDLSGYEGGSFEFDVKTPTPQRMRLMIMGPFSEGRSWIADEPTTPDVWTHVSIPLRQKGSTDASMPRSSRSTVRAALSGLEYANLSMSASDPYRIDNIRFVAPKPPEIIQGKGISGIGTDFSLSVTKSATGAVGGHLRFANPRYRPALREGDVSCVTLGDKRAVIGIVDTANESHRGDVYREFYVEDEPRGFRLTGLPTSSKLPAPGAGCRNALPKTNTGRLIRSGSMTIAQPG